jgi:uncharacterized membrane protein YvbJ
LDKDYNAETEGDIMYCEKCGMPVQNGSVFCAKCGASLNGGLNAQEQAELQRLKLHNERARDKSRRVWNVILGIALIFIGVSISFGLGAGFFTAVIAGVIGAIIFDNQTKKQMQKPKEETKA